MNQTTAPALAFLIPMTREMATGFGKTKAKFDRATALFDGGGNGPAAEQLEAQAVEEVSRAAFLLGIHYDAVINLVWDFDYTMQTMGQTIQ